MIGDYRKLLARLEAGERLGLVVDRPDPGRKGWPVWTLAPLHERVHATTAKAAIARGFPLAQGDLFPGGES
jgi:hypothetical protein